MSEQASLKTASAKGRANRIMAYGLALFVCFMVGMAYAAVPLYELFCRVTGYGGTTQVADSSAETVIDRMMTVRFDANVSNGLNWDFKALDKPVTLQVGETGQIDYQVVNVGTAASSGTATFNVTPPSAGIYFNKLECFCFTEQEVKAGESMIMPVIFFVDPDIDEDPNLKSIDTITLSYTFFPHDKNDSEEEETASAQALKPVSDGAGAGS